MWLFVLAFSCYTVSIWAHKVTKVFKPWMIPVFFVALAADMSGTYFLCVRAAKGITFTLHTASGFAALAIMALHFTWALLARRYQKSRELFDSWSPWAWGLWMVAFLSPAFPYMMRSII